MAYMASYVDRKLFLHLVNLCMRPLTGLVTMSSLLILFQVVKVVEVQWRKFTAEQASQELDTETRPIEDQQLIIRIKEDGEIVYPAAARTILYGPLGTGLSESIVTILLIYLVS